MTVVTNTSKAPTSSIEWLVNQIDIFLKANPSVDEPGFGWAAAGDPSLVTRLRAGSDIMTRTMDQIIRYLKDPENNKFKPKPRKEKSNDKIPQSKEARKGKGQAGSEQAGTGQQ